MNLKKLIVIVGPTAVGKTAFAIELAKKLNSEIISADSLQVYNEFNICTSKPSLEQLKEVKHLSRSYVTRKVKLRPLFTIHIVSLWS